MRLVALNILKQVAHLAGHVEPRVVACVVGAFEVVVRFIADVAIVLLLAPRVLVLGVFTLRLCIKMGGDAERYLFVSEYFGDSSSYHDNKIKQFKYEVHDFTCIEPVAFVFRAGGESCVLS